MSKQLYISLLATLLALPLLTRAEEVIISDTTEIISDTIVAVEDSVPDWYVAPEIPEALRSPMRATASGCLTDSILTFNVDSILSEATTYDYDAAGRTIRTTVWTYSSDGSRIGKSKTEYGFDNSSSQIYTATFAWDTNTNDWKGTSKSEYMYNESHKLESRVEYTWVNTAWIPQIAYTYVYDAEGRQTEFTTYNRNTSTNRLAPSQQLVYEWYNASKKTLEITYTAYTNGAWSAGNKKEYDYDAKGNQIEYTYYSSLSNGTWVGSTHERWTYNASNKKTYYEKQTWSNSAWANSTKELWEFNTAGKQTLHKKYSGSGNDWTITANDSSAYDAVGNNTLVENYTYTNGVAKGSKKEEYTYNSANKKLTTIKYKWSSGAFVYNTKAVNDYDAAGNTTETANYSWKNNSWVGTGTRTLQTFNSSKKVTEKITQTWPSTATDWVNLTCTTTVYSGAKTIQEASFTWSNDAWTPSTRTDYHYNAAGKNDTTTTFSTDGTNWVYLNRIINTYNASGSNIMTHNSTWNGTRWELVSMTRTDALSDAAGHQLLYATWRCGSDSVWIGLQKDSAAYSATGKQIYSASYDSWANNNWVPYYKVEYTYDAQDRLILQQRMDWNVTDWKGNYKYEYQYDAQGRQCVSATYLGWDRTTNNWIGSTKTEQTFDANNRVALSILYTWGATDWKYLFRYTYTYDSSGREIEQTVETIINDNWAYTDKYIKEYKGSTQVKNNTYKMLNNRWEFSSRYETYYDNDSQGKLRRQVSGTWNSGVVQSFSDNNYFYSCDAPASNGSQPRTPTEIEEIDENNGTYENNVQAFDPTQPTYNLSGQRVDPASYHGIVIQSGHTYLIL